MSGLRFVSEFTLPMPLVRPLPVDIEDQLARATFVPVWRCEQPLDPDIELIELFTAEGEAGFPAASAHDKHGEGIGDIANPAKFNFAGDDGVGAQGHERFSASVVGTLMMAERGAAGNAGGTPKGSDERAAQ